MSKNISAPLLLSLLLLLGINLLSTAFFPAIGFYHIRIGFNILLILYLCIRLELPYISLIILIIQFFHSAFTLEGWAHGTFTGVLLALLISTIRHSINFHTPMATVVAVQIFQTIWFIVLSGLMYIKIGDAQFLVQRFYSFLPESLCLSILAPLLFKLLDRIWEFREVGPKMGEN